MQIMQWLLKETHHFTPSIKKDIREEKVKSRDIIIFSEKGGRRSRKRLRKVEISELSCNNFNPFNNLSKRDTAKVSFYSTINLDRLGSFGRNQHCDRIMKMKKDSPGHEKVEASGQGHVGNTKVLPISDASVSSRMESHDHSNTLVKKEKGNGDKKTLSRMKELLRWAAAARSVNGGKHFGRKVLQFRNRATLKAVADDDQLSNDSPKISFRWDIDTCSITSSAYSAISIATSTNSTPAQYGDHHVRRKLNWITTDSDYVVLEL